MYGPRYLSLFGGVFMSAAYRFQSVREGANAFGRGVTRRARIHHIYFLLASFDLAAVGTGLYLSHHMKQLLGANIVSSVEWGRVQNDISSVREAAALANAPGNDLFATRDLQTELANWDTQFEALEHKLEAMKRHAVKGISPANQPEAARLIATIDKVFENVATTSTKLFDLYRRGQAEASTPAMTLMNRQNAELIAALDNFSTFLHSDLIARQKTEAVKADDMQSLEILLGAMAVAMVLAVTIFGHWIGKKFQRQYNELDAAHTRQHELMEALQASHTDVVALNSELDQLNRDLETRIEQRTRDLQSANDVITTLNVELTDSILQLKETQDESVRRGRMAQLGQLTATVAHEIRNPLGSIRTAAYLVEHRTKGHNLGIEKPIERINTAIHRCDTIITQLMDFMRTKGLSAEQVVLDEWVKACVESERHQIADCIHVELQLGAGSSVVEIDTERMHRMLLNLLKNASEAMVGHGEFLKVRKGEEPTIWISTTIDDGEALISVTDNGPGIDEENLEKILEPLFTTKNFGVGLGLPVVEEILDQHGGELEIESSPGEGATFTARFGTRLPNQRAA